MRYLPGLKNNIYLFKVKMRSTKLRLQNIPLREMGTNKFVMNEAPSNFDSNKPIVSGNYANDQLTPNIKFWQRTRREGHLRLDPAPQRGKGLPVDNRHWKIRIYRLT